MNFAVLVAVVLSQVDPGRGVLLTPKLAVGQEVTYQGTIAESLAGQSGARYEQPYQVECSMLVLGMDSKGVAEVGCYTQRSMPEQSKSTDRETVDRSKSIHFDLVSVQPNGEARWATSGARINLPPDSLPAWELGYFLRFSEEPVLPGSEWFIHSVTGHPPIRCVVLEKQSVTGIVCLCIECTQQSKNWNDATSPTFAWNLNAKYWVDPKTASIHRIKRRLETKEPHSDTASRIVTADLVQGTNLRYYGPMLQERVEDFRAAVVAQQQLESIAGSKTDPRATLSSVRRHLSHSLEKTAASPYRPAMRRMLADVLAQENASNESSPTTLIVTKSQPAKVGTKARPFVFRDVERDEPLTLAKLAGTPILLVFVDATHELSLDALRLAKATLDANPEATVRLIAVLGDASGQAVSQIRLAVPGEYTIVSGQGLDRSYRVESTPHTIVIDGAGFLRGNFVGIGPELPDQLASALTRSLPSTTARKGDNPSALRPADDAKPSFLR